MTFDSSPFPSEQDRSATASTEGRFKFEFWCSECPVMAVSGRSWFPQTDVGTAGMETSGRSIMCLLGTGNCDQN